MAESGALTNGSDSEGITARELPNFLPETEKDPLHATLRCVGTALALDALEIAIAEGVVPRPTSGLDSLCLLYALEISLRGAHADQERRTPTFAELQQIATSNVYHEEVSKRAPHYDYELLKDQFFSSKDIPVEAAIILLHCLPTLGFGNGETYQLGHVQHVGPESNHVVYLHGTPDGHAPTKTIWLYNHCIGEGRNALRHWSGMAPDWTVQVLPHQEVIDDDTINPQYIGMEDDASDVPSSLEDDTFSLDEMDVDPWPSSQMTDATDVAQRAMALLTPSKFPDKAKPNSPDGFIQTRLYRDGIEYAPYAEVQLPLHHMDGITTHELLSFFPHHVLHIGPLAARLSLEGYTFAAVAEIVNSSRGISMDAKNKHKATLQNSVRRSLLNAHNDFLEPLHSTEKEGDVPTEATLSKAKWFVRYCRPGVYRDYNPGHQQTVSIRELAQHIQPIWTCITCKGSFTDKVREELVALGEGKPEVYPNLPFDMIEMNNPPQLPLDWKPQEVYNSNVPWRVHRCGKILSHEVETIVDKEKGDADSIIEKYPHRIEGALLLWLLKRDGGQKTQTSLRLTVNQIHASPNGIKPMEKSVVSYRVRRALKLRAQERNTDEKTEVEAFYQNEAYKEKPSASKRSNGKASSGQAEEDSSQEDLTDPANPFDFVIASEPDVVLDPEVDNPFTGYESMLHSRLVEFLSHANDDAADDAEPAEQQTTWMEDVDMTARDTALVEDCPSLDKNSETAMLTVDNSAVSHLQTPHLSEDFGNLGFSDNRLSSSHIAQAQNRRRNFMMRPCEDLVADENASSQESFEERSNHGTLGTNIAENHLRFPSSGWQMLSPALFDRPSAEHVPPLQVSAPSVNNPFTNTPSPDTPDSDTPEFTAPESPGLKRAATDDADTNGVPPAKKRRTEENED